MMVLQIINRNVVYAMKFEFFAFFFSGGGVSCVSRKS